VYLWLEESEMFWAAREKCVFYSVMKLNIL